VKFNEAVSVSLAALSLQDLSYGTTGVNSSLKLSYPPSTHIATKTFPSLVGGLLTAGKHPATLNQSFINDSGGRHLRSH
jgi:hypothetical protein